MSDDGWEVALPPFNAEGTLQTLKRFIRDLGALTERSEGWTLRGSVVLKLAVDGASIRAHLARRPASTPEWDVFTLKSAPDARKLQDEIRRRLVRWKDDV
ncbi:hypothetical protein ACG02S_17470 [Roseateles sp. DC23W]|uniref:Uncharacterized protein n=1 Tax=Pelomonas dachongensis TaxID=3299029 RepID=A0ABW7ETV7_9BURK